MIQQSQQEQATYVLAENKKRAIIPKIILLIILGIVFYLGILINVSLLKMSADQETTVKLTALIIVIILIILGIFLTIRKAKQTYQFYRNNIKKGKKQILYREIIDTTIKQNIIDKIFKTYSIPLSKKFQIKHIPQEVQIGNYLQQMINYVRTIS